MTRFLHAKTLVCILCVAFSACILLPQVSAQDVTNWNWNRLQDNRDARQSQFEDEKSSNQVTWESFISSEGEEEEEEETSSYVDVWDAFLTSDRAYTSAVANCADTVMQQISRDDELALLTKALQQAGLSTSLGGPGYTTIFAPTDAAFIDLGKGGQGAAVLNLDLQEVLEYHVSDEKVNVDPDQALQEPSGSVSKSLRSLTGKPLSVEITPFSGTVNADATILEQREACNGQIIKVDRVLLPQSQSVDLSRSNTEVEACDSTSRCCDIEPPNYSCKEQAEWGKCDEEWLKVGKYCRKSCGFCFDGGDDRPPATEFSPEDEDEYYGGGSSDPLSNYVREGLLYQQWRDIGGWKISDMTRSSKILEEPTASMVLDASGDTFRAPEPYVSAKNSVSRMTGFFCAPLSGDYRFRLSSDDSGRLFISDGPADEKQRLAKISGWKRPSEWVTSSVIELEKGQSYFLEAMQKQMDGEGHLKVGVRLPNGATLDTIPVDYFSANCKSMPSSVGRSLPVPPTEEACSCTKDGYSGPSDSRVDTGRKGCFSYDYKEDLLTGAESMGQRLGRYFTNRWGAAPDASQRLANYWEGLATSATERDHTTKICYVKYPEYCPVSIPSREVPGAQWRRC